MKQIKNILMLLGVALQINLMQASASITVADWNAKILNDIAKVTKELNKKHKPKKTDKFLMKIQPSIESLITNYQSLAPLLTPAQPTKTAFTPIVLTGTQMTSSLSGGSSPKAIAVSTTEALNVQFPVSVMPSLTLINIGLTNKATTGWLVFNFDSTVINRIVASYPNILNDGLYITIGIGQPKNARAMVTVSLTDTSGNPLASGQLPTTMNLDWADISFNTASSGTANPAKGSTALIGVPINRKILYQQQTTTSDIIIYNQPSSGQAIHTSLSGSDVIHKVVIKLANNTKGPDITLTSAQVAALIAAASEGSFWVNTVAQNNTLYYVFLGAATNSVIVTGSAPFNGNQIQIRCYMTGVALTEPGYVNPGKSVHIQF